MWFYYFLLQDLLIQQKLEITQLHLNKCWLLGMCEVEVIKSITSFDTYTFDFNWTVKSADGFLKSQANLESQKFSPNFTVNGYQISWCLHLDCQQTGFRYSLYAKATLGLQVKGQDKCDPPKRIFAKGILFLKGKEDGDCIFSKQAKRWIDLGASTPRLFVKNYKVDLLEKDFMAKDSLQAYLRVKVYLVEQPNHTVDDNTPPPRFNLSKALNDARLNNVFSDVTLVCGSSEFKVHWVILASQSSFFKTRFEERWETSGNRVDMSDLSPQILEAIINFTYTGEVANIDDISLELFAAAEMYQLPALKTLCEQSLWKLLTLDTSVSFMKMATTYNAPTLREQIFEFIVANPGMRKCKE